MAIRCIVNAKYNDHTGPIFKDLKILPLRSLIQLNSLQFMSDFKYNRLPRAFSDLWFTNQEVNLRYNLRNQNDFRIPFFRTEVVKRFPKFSMPKIWNEFNSEQIKNISSKLGLKANLKKCLLGEVPTECLRLNCPQCAA